MSDERRERERGERATESAGDELTTRLRDAILDAARQGLSVEHIGNILDDTLDNALDDARRI